MLCHGIIDWINHPKGQKSKKRFIFFSPFFFCFWRESWVEASLFSFLRHYYSVVGLGVPKRSQGTQKPKPKTKLIGRWKGIRFCKIITTEKMYGISNSGLWESQPFCSNNSCLIAAFISNPYLFPFSFLSSHRPWETPIRCLMFVLCERKNNILQRKPKMGLEVENFGLDWRR